VTDPSTPPELYELEREIIEEIWRQGPLQVRPVRDALNARSERPRAYTTVMTTMQRMARKGLLTPSRNGQADVYAATFSRDEYREARARAQIEDLVDEYGETALVHFARQMAELDPDQRRRLQRLARDA
jgi:predicted transcriptional regulator